MITRKEAEENSSKAKKMPTDATFRYTENTIRQRSLKGAPFASQELYLPTAPALKEYLELKDFKVLYYTKDTDSSYCYVFTFWDTLAFHNYVHWAKSQNFPVLCYTNQRLDELTRNTDDSKCR